jgi:hypothetical protein
MLYILFRCQEVQRHCDETTKRGYGDGHTQSSRTFTKWTGFSLLHLVERQVRMGTQAETVLLAPREAAFSADATVISCQRSFCAVHSELARR